MSSWLFTAWVLARKEAESLFFLSVSAIVTAYIKIIRGFLLGPNGITKEVCHGDGYSLSSEMLFCLEHHLLWWHLKSLGRCYLHMFSSVSRGQYWDGTLLVFGHKTRKWQSPDSNTGRFPTEAYHVQFFSHYIFLELWKKAHNIKFTILTLFKHMV